MVMQIFLSGALSLLWNIFNTLQLVIAMKLVLISMPANVELIYELIEETVNFQIIPKDDLYDSMIAGPFDLPTS